MAVPGDIDPCHLIFCLVYKNIIHSEGRGEEWVSHPINSLYLIKRLGLELTRANIPGILGNNNTEVHTIHASIHC